MHVNLNSFQIGQILLLKNKFTRILHQPAPNMHTHKNTRDEWKPRPVVPSTVCAAVGD